MSNIKLKLFVVILTATFLFSCVSHEKPVNTVVVEEQKPALNIENPVPLELTNTDIILIKKDGKWYVSFELDDYKIVAKNSEKIQNYILKQRLIINKYKQYYEPSK